MKLNIDGKFEVAGGLEMTFLLTLPHPEPKTIGQLSERIGETVKVSCEFHQGDLGLDEAAEEPPA